MRTEAEINQKIAEIDKDIEYYKNTIIEAPYLSERTLDILSDDIALEIIRKDILEWVLSNVPDRTKHPI